MLTKLRRKVDISDGPPKRTRPRNKAGYASGLIFILVLVIPLVILLITEREMIRDFILTAMVAIGGGGLYGVFIDGTNSVTLGKYKATGAVALVLIILFFFVVLTWNTQTRESNSGVNPASLGVREHSRSHYTNKMFIFASNSSEGGFTSVQDTSRSFKSLRIVYPAGADTLKAKAFALERTIKDKYPASEVSVYSLGNIVGVVINKLSEHKNKTIVAFNQDLTSRTRTDLLNQIRKSGTDAEAVQDPAVKKLGKEEVIILLGN